MGEEGLVSGGVGVVGGREGGRWQEGGGWRAGGEGEGEGWRGGGGGGEGGEGGGGGGGGAVGERGGGAQLGDYHPPTSCLSMEAPKGVCVSVCLCAG